MHGRTTPHDTEPHHTTLYLRLLAAYLQHHSLSGKVISASYQIADFLNAHCISKSGKKQADYSQQKHHTLDGKTIAINQQRNESSNQSTQW